jgi:hypothetical protein
MIQWILAIVFVEAVTEIIVSSTIFFRLRNWIAKKSDFLGSLINCGYCMSVWVSATVGWVLPGEIFLHFFPGIMAAMAIDCVLKVFILHRVSNVFHEGLSRWFNRLPWVFVVNKIDEDEESEIEE